MARLTSERQNFWTISGLIMKLSTLIFIAGISSVSCQDSAVPCVDVRGSPQRCHPEFENAAFQLDVEASNTCGEDRRQKYCRQTGATGVTKQCSYCDSYSATEKHPPRYLTDIHEEENMTWWQSETMYEGVQYPHAVNLTLSLGKSFEITYIRLKFYSPRPESFAVYKRTTQDGPWIPYQYYSGSCEATFGVDTDEFVTRADETKPLCTAMFSDISPLTGGNIAFSTLEERPSAYQFDDSAVLQEWVTATDILVMLSRLNTFGDEVFKVPDVLRSYYYAISDFSIGGRCKCNGHASSCIPGVGLQRLVCECEHNTDGPDCERCLPFYNDRPWARGTSTAVNECRACNCNGQSETCFFDQRLYDSTGHGGHCTDCRRNTAGVNCERCETNYYEDRNGECIDCQCDPIGSLHLQCDSRGSCQCRDGVGGVKCDRCLPNFHDFGVTGCRSCDCYVAGSMNNQPECDSYTGRCSCKENVEGKQCERCKAGFFNLQESDQFGCMACFCYGHSSDCTSAPGFELSFVDDDFTSGLNDWMVEYADGSVDTPVYNAIRRDIAVASDEDTGEVYFVAPDKYLGDKRSSYGRDFSFQLRLGSGDIVLSPKGLILEGDGITIYAPIVAQGNSRPGIVAKKYTFSLRNERDLGWVQNPTAYDVQRVLSNLSGLKIRATYSQGAGQGFLDNVRLETVRRSTGPGGESITSIELCRCPDGYVGQFCESCAAGFRREPPSGGPYAMCIPCECNGHSDICDVDTGVCICQHNTLGDNCEFCQPGYYGNALDGTPFDCQLCPCPGGSECVQDAFGEVICINCPPGYVGNRCEMCADGFYGDPYGEYGVPTPCIRCDCNGNVDSNAVGNCNSTTGECLKCVYNTAGFYCDECDAGYYGDALGEPKGQCQPCNCFGPGSESFECNQRNGQCDCLPFVKGRDCSYCRNRYWNIKSGRGCEPCDCDNVGTVQPDCDEDSGQCECKPGVGGQTCDRCLFDHHGFSAEGCTPCNCNPQGSRSLNCTYDGVCDCQDGVIGDKCDSCEENFYNIALGCVQCPDCYSLVQDKVNAHRQKLEDLKNLLQNIGENPEVVSDVNFEKQLKALEAELDVAVVEAERAINEDKVLKSDMDAMEMMYDMLMDQVRDIRNVFKTAEENTQGSEDSQEETFEIIDDAKMRLVEAQQFLDGELDRLKNQFNETAKNQSAQDRMMQQLAEEARTLVVEQGEQAETMEPVASEALNTSLAALEAVKNVSDFGKLDDGIQDLEDRFQMANDDFEKAMQTATDVKEMGEDALDDANTFLSQARQPLVDVDVPALNNSANDIKLQADAILKEAEMISKQNEMLLDQIEADSQKAADLLKDSMGVQQELDLLLAKADKADADAKAATKKGNETLEEAHAIKTTLETFEEQVDQSRKEATDAMLKIDEIRMNIDMANETALSAKETIDAAQGDAMMARDVAIAEREKAKPASEAAKDKLAEAEEEKEAAQFEKDRADSLAVDVNSTMMRLNAIDGQSRNDSAAAQEAQVKANAADKSSTQAMDAVDDAIRRVQALMDALGDLDDIDEDALETAENNFANLNSTYWNDLDVDGIMERMRGLQEVQETEIKSHQLSLEEIKKQVQNVQDISDSLPEFCPFERSLEKT
ncbi:laminin subunit gamma-1-like isoform X1 [Apostichopus japonicus]|uniref:laminin subunit gamma-1-like isoform X1 n=1 Tax=Stichopus japonicus TaxID=307972 RepID=UPI003AB5DF28